VNKGLGMGFRGTARNQSMKAIDDDDDIIISIKHST
jgi:hypothetical protein